MISISLCMIVRDEEAVLARCLDCIREAVDEIVVVDTGSEDGTREIARRYTEKVLELPWRDDFSEARNFAFSRASGDYCMWMDADDVISPANLGKLLRLKENLQPEVDVVMMPYIVAFDEEGNPEFSYFRERIVRNSPQYRFQGKVHEAISPNGYVIYADIPVEHRKEKRGDGRRNLRIYQKMRKEGEPMDARSLYYYGRELLTHGEYREGIRILKEFLGRPEGWVENQIDATRQLARCYYGEGREREALEALLAGLKYDVPRGETCCDLGRHFMDRGRYQQAIFWYRQALNAEKKAESGAFVQEDCYGFLPAISLCICYDRLGRRKEAEYYNELAGKYKPRSPYVLQNKIYFASHRVTGKRTED